MRYLQKEHLAVIIAASTDKTRYIINGVLLEEIEGGLRAVATGGRILAVVETKTELKEEDFPVIEAFEAAKNTATKTIVPVKALVQVMKAISKKATIPVLHNAAVKMSEKATTLATTDLETPSVTEVRNIDGEYPNWEQCIPKDEATTFNVCFDPANIHKACEILEGVVGKGNSVEFKFSGDPKKPVKIVGSGRGVTATVVVMPMKGPMKG